MARPSSCCITSRTRPGAGAVGGAAALGASASKGHTNAIRETRHAASRLFFAGLRAQQVELGLSLDRDGEPRVLPLARALGGDGVDDRLALGPGDGDLAVRVSRVILHVDVAT